MGSVRMYCTRICPYCHMAERLLVRKGVEIEKIYVDDHPEQRAEMVQVTGQTTVPQIFIGSRHIGGYRDLAELDHAGALAALLESS